MAPHIKKLHHQPTVSLLGTTNHRYGDPKRPRGRRQIKQEKATTRDRAPPEKTRGFIQEFKSVACRKRRHWTKGEGGGEKGHVDGGGGAKGKKKGKT